MASPAASHYPDGIFKGTGRSGSPDGNLRTSGNPFRVPSRVSARPLGHHHRNRILRCRRGPASLRRPQAAAPGRLASKPGRWGRTASPPAPSRAKRPPGVRAHVGPARAEPGPGGGVVGGRGPAGARPPGCARAADPRPPPAPPPLPSSPSLGLRCLHSRAAIYLEWVIPACLPRAASRSPEVEH
ncbi:WAS/WASL-interacting protein family member 1-like [Hyaena hyaena]|uniref:WAS/WASL-interacting protein family member 1-like n=1 Tax=Hyaena hyaena TaxID=95912 RepID=UPI0019225698|nr:WAS/WASL-interacting protein family member 1-like [Hyaena hyaena]